jgi:hypothetical protein
LDEILEGHPPDVVHFLKIDCEGAEVLALRGCSFEKTRPWIVLVEATEPLSQAPAYAEWEPLVLGRGYHFVYADGLNRYYVADEKRELDPAFAYPPNVFDSYIRASEASTRDALGALQGEAVALRHNVEHLQAENSRREQALVEYRRAVAQALARETQDRAELGRMHKEVELRDTEVARLNAEVAGLHERIRAMHLSTSWRITRPLRGAKRAVRRPGKAVGRAVYFVLRWPARAIRPLLRWLARWSWVREMAARIVGTDTVLGRHARLFLFGAPPAPEGECEDAPRDGIALTHHAANILAEIQRAKPMQGADEGSAGSL